MVVRHEDVAVGVLDEDAHREALDDRSEDRVRSVEVTLASFPVGDVGRDAEDRSALRIDRIVRKLPGLEKPHLPVSGRQWLLGDVPGLAGLDDGAINGPEPINLLFGAGEVGIRRPLKVADGRSVGLGGRLVCEEELAGPVFDEHQLGEQIDDLAQLGPRRLGSLFVATPFDSVVNPVGQDSILAGAGLFLQVVRDAGRDRVAGDGFTTLARVEDERQAGRPLAHRFEKLKSVHAGHLVVAHDAVDLLVGESL